MVLAGAYSGTTLSALNVRLRNANSAKVLGVENMGTGNGSSSGTTTARRTTGGGPV